MSTYRRVAIIGTGTMGPGMGAVLARAGMEVALYDINVDHDLGGGHCDVPDPIIVNRD